MGTLAYLQFVAIMGLRWLVLWGFCVWHLLRRVEMEVGRVVEKERLAQRVKGEMHQRKLPVKQVETLREKLAEMQEEILEEMKRKNVKQKKQMDQDLGMALVTFLH